MSRDTPHPPHLFTRVTPQPVIAEVYMVGVGTAGFAVGNAAEAAVDGLPREAGARCLDFGDNVAPREFDVAGAPMESVDGAEDGVLAAGASVDELCLLGRKLIEGPWIVSWRFVLCKPRPA